MTDAGSMDEVRDRLVLAALAHVPFEGWSQAALKAGAADEGFDPTMAERAFPGGPVEAVLHFSALADRRLLEEASRSGLAEMRLSQRIAWLVRRRLEAWSGQREALGRAIALLALPMNAKAAMTATARTVDALWRAAGDMSADFSWYTKRVSLGLVWTATVLVWLEDNSENAQESWEFLDRRLQDVLRLPKLRARFEAQLKRLPNPMKDLNSLLRGRRPSRRAR